MAGFGEPESFVQIVVNDRPMIEVDWLEECFRQVRFPQSKCEVFLAEVNSSLSHHIKGELDNKHKQQVLFQLLGADYVRIHFPHHKYQPELLDRIKPDLKKAYTKEMKQFIEEQLVVTLKELGYPEDVSQAKANSKLSDFIKVVTKVVKKGLDIQILKDVERNRLQDIELAVDEASGGTNNQDKMSSNGGNVAVRSSHVSAAAFVGVCKVNTQVQQTALNEFRKQKLPLPWPMRKFFWQEIIKWATLSSARAQSLEGDFKQQLNKLVKKGGTRAVQSEQYNQIYSVLIDCYTTSKVLQGIADDARMLEAAHIINVVNSVTKKFNNSFIYCVVPLQQLFAQEDGERDERHIVKLSNLLYSLTTHLVPLTKQVFDAATEVLKQLNNIDPEYEQHLRQCLKIDVSHPGQIHSFPQNCLLPDANKSVALWKDLYRKPTKNWKSTELEIFTNPEIFVRKWIAEAFCGILSGPTLFYVWDLLFLSEWALATVKELCVVLLLLLKSWASRAQNQQKLIQVLLDEPSNLYIADIRSALMQLDKRKIKWTQVSGLNGNIELIDEDHDAAQTTTTIVDETPAEDVKDNEPISVTVDEAGQDATADEVISHEENEVPLSDEVTGHEDNDLPQQHDVPDADQEDVPVVKDQKDEDEGETV